MSVIQKQTTYRHQSYLRDWEKNKHVCNVFHQNSSLYPVPIVYKDIVFNSILLPLLQLTFSIISYSYGMFINVDYRYYTTKS